jgi:hypothetical protein
VVVVVATHREALDLREVPARELQHGAEERKFGVEIQLQLLGRGCKTAMLRR